MHQPKTFNSFPILLKNWLDSQTQLPSSLICHPHADQRHFTLPTLAMSSFCQLYLPCSSVCCHLCLECSSAPSSLNSLEPTFQTLTQTSLPDCNLNWAKVMWQALLSQLQLSICFVIIWLTVSSVEVEHVWFWSSLYPDAGFPQNT